jgi:Na+/H+-dicarboxylate symporter
MNAGTAILKHPATILAAVAAGVAIGLGNAGISAAFGVKNFAGLIAIPGQIYLFYLQMTVIPIIITAIASSLGRLMRSNMSRGLIKKIIVIMLAGLGVAALAGILIGFFGKPGAGLDENTRSLLTSLISSSPGQGGASDSALEVLLYGAMPDTQAARPGLATFFTSLVPSNIFAALAQGSTMAVVFFSIAFGIVIGFLKSESASLIINLLSAIFEAFQKLVSSSLYLLPFGLICLMAGQIAQVGVQVFMAMSKFIILYIGGTVMLFVACTVVIWLRSGIKNPLKVISILFEPIMLAFATRNSMACLPSTITCLDRGMDFDTNTVNLTLPLGITLGRFGNIFYFGIAVFFVAQIYGADITLPQIPLVFLGVLLAGTATAGASGIVTLSVISIALNPLNLPSEAVLVIFMAIDPIIDPFRTFLLVYANMAVTALLAERHTGFSPNELIVVIRRAKERAPILFHDTDGSLAGIEMAVLREIARRLGKKLVLREGHSYTLEEAEIVAGYVFTTDSPPPGYMFSQSYGNVKEENKIQKLSFILPARDKQTAQINRIIDDLRNEDFIKQSAERGA